jgi:hypothetical protein
LELRSRLRLDYGGRNLRSRLNYGDKRLRSRLNLRSGWRFRIEVKIKT